MIAAAAILLLAAAQAQASPAGFYQTQQMEVGGALELQPGGHFRYQLDYGAVSEGAEGDWTFDGKTVRLTTKPKPRGASFALVRDDPAPKGELSLALEPPGFGWEGSIDALVTVEGSNEKARVRTEEDGRIEVPPGIKVVAVEPLVPIYATIGGKFPLSTDRGHHLLLRFQPTDLGKADFNGETLQLKDGELLLGRYETMIRFVRVRP